MLDTGSSMDTETRKNQSPKQQSGVRSFSWQGLTRTCRTRLKPSGLPPDGKILVDVTNVIGEGMTLAVGFSTSGAEELQKLIPKAHVVRAFNAVFAQNQSTGHLDKEQLTLFVAGDDATAKQTLMRLGKDIGFDPVDAGPLRSARYLEPMAMQLINLGLVLGMGTKIGYKLVKG